MIRHVLDFVFANGGRSDRAASQSSPADFMFMLNGICVFRGEESAAGDIMVRTPCELGIKMTWSYGDVPYLFGYSAVGSKVNLYAFPHDGPGPISTYYLGTYYLDRLGDRLRLLKALLNLSRLFWGIVADCPDTGRQEFRSIVQSNGVVLHLNKTQVQKVFPKHMDFDKIANHLKRVYAQMEANQIPNVDRFVSVDADARCVTLEPRGMQTKPSTMSELFRALRDILEALVKMHAASLMHRDIRWPNVMKHSDGPESWFLIDFVDSASSPQDSLRGVVFSREEHAPELFKGNGAHTTAVDIWSVGYLISSIDFDVSSSWFDRGKERCQFEASLLDQDPAKRPTAEEALERLALIE